MSAKFNALIVCQIINRMTKKSEVLTLAGVRKNTRQKSANIRQEMRFDLLTPEVTTGLF